MLQSRRAADVVKTPTIEARHVEVTSGRAEPLSFMTIQTVEGIVRNMDIEGREEHATWERRMEKFMNLGDAYSSSVNTHSGEKCYMVDGALYKETERKIISHGSG